MAPENVHLYYINKTLININIPRYKLFRNVSLKFSSLNKSSYEWSSKAIFNTFSLLKSSQRFTGTILRRNQNSFEEDWMFHSCNKQLYAYPIDGYFVKPRPCDFISFLVLTIISCYLVHLCVLLYIFISLIWIVNFLRVKTTSVLFFSPSLTFRIVSGK